jgi:hypothetical protein
MRFQRTNELGVGGWKVFNRVEVGPDEDWALFLGRLWAHFGPAEEVDNGFSYRIVDRDTGHCFEAYSGPSGPAYGAHVPPEALLPVVRAFEELLATTRPADCSFETSREIDYGGGRVVIGVSKGKPFEKEKKVRRRAAKSAKSYEDCVEIAKARGGHYGIDFGWQTCLEEVLPELPEEVEIDGRVCENNIGFGLSDRGVPVYGFDEGDGIEEFPVSRIKWPKPLPAVAKLWLDSQERWRKPKPKSKSKSKSKSKR